MISDHKQSRRTDKHIEKLDDRILELESAVRALEAESAEENKKKNPV
jgi:hypothetical protein